MPILQPLIHPRLPAAGEALHWPGLQAGARALALAEAALADARPWVVVCPDTRSLEQLATQLRFLAGEALEVLTLPDWEILPYDQFSPHADIVSERLRTLARLPGLRRGVLLIGVEGLPGRLPPTRYVHARSFDLRVGAALAIEPLRLKLVDAGYASVSQVRSPGEFALRGSLFDVWPMGHATPVRVDLLDDRIDSLKAFDAETQRSLDPLDKLQLLPARELPLDAGSVKDFRRRFRLRFEGDVARMPVYRGVAEGLAPPGIEFYLPLFFEETAGLLDYLPGDAVIACEQGLADALAAAWAGIEARWEAHRHDVERPLLPPAEAFIEPSGTIARIATHPRVLLPRLGTGSDAQRTFRIDPRAPEPLAPLATWLDAFEGRVLVAADSAGRREVIAQMLSAHGRSPRAVAGWQAFAEGAARLAITVAADLEGLELADPPLALLTEGQLFGTRARQERRRRRAAADPNQILRDLQSLEPGSPVVHETYGVGRYLGLEVMEIGGDPGEFLLLEYRDGDRVYVPVHALHLVSRYAGGTAESAPLHKLGTEQWGKARRKAAEAVRDAAAELLDLYARRQAGEAPVLRAGEAEWRAFQDAFPFEETADQGEAIARVVEDMGKATPMDRIVCGDVGFGKTEVAMRAAFVAVQAGHQVVVLVPTTLLAEQHGQSFRDRFADWPVRIEVLSRFRSGKEGKALLAGLEEGKVDIVIATHRLLHADARPRRLGLMIVDEEHRFGVRDKERLKALRASVHVLTLTATPIPRTLNMALGGLRELSLISTPPATRIAIKTTVCEWHGPTLREAALRELRRGGQLYLVHNEIEGIEKLAAEFQQLVPEAQVRVGHGQMRERELEQLMVDFYHRRFNVLVCTTIIESGIDVPTANTILINRADRFGLAQLHQLRGRVGRSHHRAYAYLIVPSRRALAGDAARRLEAIESLEDLGAGFLLATHDLEIRGAGEFLGERQSGELTEVGLGMYLDMLGAAVDALRRGDTPQLDQPLAATSEVELRVPAFLPDTYVPDVHLRLSLYQRIAGADPAGMDDLHAELVDRFGPLPPQATHLLRLAALRQQARALGLRRLDLGPHGGSVQFGEAHRVDARAVIGLIQKESREFRMEGPTRLRITRELATAEARCDYAARLMGRLGSPS